MKSLNELRDEIHENAVKHGFYDDEINALNASIATQDGTEDALKNAFFAQKIALIHSELSEALEADRKNIRNHSNLIDECLCFEKGYKSLISGCVEDELADVIIRVLDLCGHLKIDIEKYIALKMKYNSTREYKHNKAF